LITLCIVVAVGLYAINDLAPLRIIGQSALSPAAEFFRRIGDYGIPIGGAFAIAFFTLYVKYVPTKSGRELGDRYRKYLQEKVDNRMRTVPTSSERRR
jgi:hypothetical protein